VQAQDSGGFVVRQFTAVEVADAIAVRDLEGHGARRRARVSRQLALELRLAWTRATRPWLATLLTVDYYARYAHMGNDRLHGLILQACGNRALQRAGGAERQAALRACLAMLLPHAGHGGHGPGGWKRSCSPPCWWTRCSAARARAIRN
jgi:GntR family transcriptional regulator of vanillate catabolism